MSTKRIVSLILAVAFVLLNFAACSKGIGSVNINKKAAKESISVCLGSEPVSIDPAINSDTNGASLLVHLFSGLAKWTQDKDGKLVVVPDAAKKLTKGEKNKDGKVTYKYEIKDGLKWTDGRDVMAEDFVFAWQRAASFDLAAKYGYLFSVIDGYDKVAASDKNGNAAYPKAKLNVKAVNSDTLEVTLKHDVPYWNELLAFPAFFPVREDVVKNNAWANDPATLVSNGVYKIKTWNHNSLITVEKNENHPDVSEISMNRINFYLSDDEANMVANFKKGDWNFIDSVPTKSIKTIKEEYPDEYYNAGLPGTYYLCWNINKNILPKNTKLKGNKVEKARAEIRNTLSLLIDRNYIVESVTLGGQLPAATFVATRITDADGTTEFRNSAGSGKGFDGYFDTSAEAFKKNCDSAVKTLKKYYKYDGKTKKFKNFPKLNYVYDSDESNKAIAENIKSTFAKIGIEVTLQNEDINTLLNTRKDGDFTIARNDCFADYNDPISFLDIWTSSSSNNEVQFGKFAHKNVKVYNVDLTKYGSKLKVKNGTWSQTYDKLINEIKSCTDVENRYAMMHLAEDTLMQSGCITPIYYYSDNYMLNKSVSGFFANPLGYKYFMYCKYA